MNKLQLGYGMRYFNTDKIILEDSGTVMILEDSFHIYGEWLEKLANISIPLH